MLTQADWRKAEGISQQKLASLLTAALGRTVRQSTVNAWEHGTMPGADCAFAISRISGGKVNIGSYGKRCPPA